MDYKILVNKKNKITKNVINNRKLVKMTNGLGEVCEVEKKTYQEFLKLKEKLKEIGIDIDIASAYRKREEDCSEHNTALAIDVMVNKKEHLEKIHPYLKDYGFIVRYPNKPWHIRYVGKSTAEIIDKKNLTLEEYHELYDINGILVVNKEEGMTSFDVVREVGKIFDTKKVGHTGTLDPIASGVLILTIGKATKISEMIMSHSKEYIATVKVGIETDTLDITGKVLKQVDVTVPSNIEKILKTFEKTYFQEVPIYSAVKVKGKKLYEYARKKQKVDLPKKEVTIKEIELLTKEKDTFTFRTVVSKGTYIRSLIRDIGTSLEIPLTMSGLIRTKEYHYTLEDSYTLKEIKKNHYQILGIDEILKFPVIEIDENLYQKIMNGNKVFNKYQIEDKVIFKYQEKVVAIYEVENDMLKCYKNFVSGT